MRSNRLSLFAATFCIGFVPACTPLVRQDPAHEPLVAPVPKPVEVQERWGGVVPASVQNHPELLDVSVKPTAEKHTIIEAVRDPVTAASPDLIPEPRSLEPPGPVKAGAPAEPATDAGVHSQPIAESAEEPPVVQALRCYLDNRPAEAVALLGRYDKSSQDLLLCLLPLTARLTEGGLERCNAREASALVKQMDRISERVSALLRPRAKLGIKKMCFCSAIEGYGKYIPRPDALGFLPGESAKVYIELENPTEQRHGNAYSVHLHSSIEIRDFKETFVERPIKRQPESAEEPDVSLSERHDFHMWCRFVVPRDLLPGFYTLRLRIVDTPTGRSVDGTLDFRVTSAHAKSQW
jgi:hypothetical protein